MHTPAGIYNLVLEFLLSIDEENIIQFINAFVHAYNNNDTIYVPLLF